MARTVNRSAGSGRFVSNATAARWPGKTTTERSEAAPATAGPSTAPPRPAGSSLTRPRSATPAAPSSRRCDGEGPVSAMVGTGSDPYPPSSTQWIEDPVTMVHTPTSHGTIWS